MMMFLTQIRSWSKLEIPFFRAVLVARLIGQLRPHLFTDTEAYEVGSFARKGLGLLAGAHISPPFSLTYHILSRLFFGPSRPFHE